MAETLRRQEAFDHYYSEGDKRSYVSTARRFNVAKKTIERWSKACNWQERIQQRDIENAKALEKKTNTTVVNEKANHRKTIKDALSVFIKNLKEKKIQVATVQDAERLIKLDLLLMGEATERSEERQTLRLDKLTDEELRVFERALETTSPNPEPEH